MKHHLLSGIAVVVVVSVIAAGCGKKEKAEQPNGLAMPTPPARTSAPPTIKRPGPEPSQEAQQRCMKKYPKDAVARTACEQGVIGITDEERLQKLDEAWSRGLNTKR